MNPHFIISRILIKNYIRIVLFYFSNFPYIVCFSSCVFLLLHFWNGLKGNIAQTWNVGYFRLNFQRKVSMESDQSQPIRIKNS